MTSEVKTSKSELLQLLKYPLDPAIVLRKRRSIRTELLQQANLTPTRIAILGGSTTAEIKALLEIFLLSHGIEPTFYESGYNRYSEDVLFENAELWNFKPDIIFIHTTWRNISEFPELMEAESTVEQRIGQEMHRFESIWTKIHAELGAMIIQNNFDLPDLRPLGNLEASQAFGRVNFLHRLNAEFASYAQRHSRFLINDILYLSAQVGLERWFAPSYWYNFHTALSPAASVALAHNVGSMIKAVYGKSKKCLVLDLDNTLWGGVIGDDGVQNLILGRDHPLGEIYLDFQRYVKGLQKRGIILAVCSKNDFENAKAGFSHPDTVLKFEDFSVFKANWNAKPQNIREIAEELNIGFDSLVFVDDNPAERAFVRDQMPEVSVPEVGSDASRFAEVLEHERYFEVDKIVQDDVNRSAFYSSNVLRSASQERFRDYGEFLASLEMTAEIAPFSPVYLERITQLINKTNQFNLTTKRYTIAEVESMTLNSEFLTLYGRLSDKFGDNGLVSVLIGHISDQVIELDLWLMSCRVINRELEFAMFDALVEQCQTRGIRKIVGVYIPSKKNGMVANHYASLGFANTQELSKDGARWQFDVPEPYVPRTRYIHKLASIDLAPKS